MKKDPRYKLLLYFCAIFYALMLYKWLNGLLLYQLEPAFFYTRKDLVTWLVMQTGIHQWVLNNHAGCVLFDTLFYAMPLICLLAYRYRAGSLSVLAIFMLAINWCYVQCYTLYPSNSIEGHIAWLLFPAVFIPSSNKTCLLVFEGLRYFFLYFMMSAGIWKLAQGGLFNQAQMSGILLFQHNQLLTNSPGYWQSNFILFLIRHELISFSLYLSATLLELFFFIGFFTKKYDKVLLLLFGLFLLMDQLVMRIPYYEVTPMALTLWFSAKMQDSKLLAA